jgi:hypothetical protein
MKLKAKNYHSKEANLHYMSNSQYKSFIECEARTMAELHGVWLREETDAMLFGKYVHAWNEGRLEEFKKECPQLFKKDGELYSKYVHVSEVINTIKNDELLMKSLSGKKEVIFTAELFGMPWKILIDSYYPEARRFCDLKVLKSLKDKFWETDKTTGNMRYHSVFEYRGYFTQVALYAEIERLANKRKGGDYCEPFLTVVTKEKVPDKAIVSFSSTEESHADFIARELSYIESHVERIKGVKSGKETPNCCNTCEYCRSTKKLTGTTHYSEFEY